MYLEMKQTSPYSCFMRCDVLAVKHVQSHTHTNTHTHSLCLLRYKAPCTVCSSAMSRCVFCCMLLYIYTHVYAYVYVYVCVCCCVCARVYTYMYIYICMNCIYMYLCVCVCVCVCIHVVMWVFISICCILYIYIYMYICIYIYIYKYTHTHTHTHTHTNSLLVQITQFGTGTTVSLAPQLCYTIFLPRTNDSHMQAQIHTWVHCICHINILASIQFQMASCDLRPPAS
jgi:hypothetical protein